MLQGPGAFLETSDLAERPINGILVPFWMAKKQQQGVPLDQPCILQLDCWVIHRSIAFRTWLDVNHPWIHYCFVPAGTTGVAQPCDVGIQRSLKLAIKELQHKDIVSETLSQLTAGKTPDDLRLDVTKPTLRDRRSLCAVVHRGLQAPQQAWHHTKAGADNMFNLSFESLTSLEARRMLRDLPQTAPDMWECIQLRRQPASEDAEAVTQDTEVVTESVPEDNEEEPGDDAPLELLLQFVASGMKCAPDGYRIDVDGSLVVDSAGDTFEEVQVAISTDPDTTFGRGKRRHVANKQYDVFEEH
ncbi:uncharacterized protein F5891DRAFT_1190586 [Suillus fuscotomentosus]|nr:uncharacterized protein F5891DRAFT_1190586 [Suillus fuscotomentosus]KAG1898796.1 hypothetical protein F5891DRAFT_1190586 [Suillus fuscotomentosus]